MQAERGDSASWAELRAEGEPRSPARRDGARSAAPRSGEAQRRQRPKRDRHPTRASQKSPKKKPKKRGRRRREGPTAWQGSGTQETRPRASAASEARKENDPRREISRKDTQPCVCSGVCERGDCPARASERSERSLVYWVCAARSVTGCGVCRWLVLCVPVIGVVCSDGWCCVFYCPPHMVSIASISGVAVFSVLNDDQ